MLRTIQWKYCWNVKEDIEKELRSSEHVFAQHSYHFISFHLKKKDPTDVKQALRLYIYLHQKTLKIKRNQLLLEESFKRDKIQCNATPECKSTLNQEVKRQQLQVCVSEFIKYQLLSGDRSPSISSSRRSCSCSCWYGSERSFPGQRAAEAASQRQDGDHKLTSPLTPRCPERMHTSLGSVHCCIWTCMIYELW